MFHYFLIKLLILYFIDTESKPLKFIIWWSRCFNVLRQNIYNRQALSNYHWENPTKAWPKRIYFTKMSSSFDIKNRTKNWVSVWKAANTTKKSTIRTMHQTFHIMQITGGLFFVVQRITWHKINVCKAKETIRTIQVRTMVMVIISM